MMRALRGSRRLPLLVALVQLGSWLGGPWVAPASEYPPEMVSMFADVRGRMFGAVRVAGLEPRAASVLFDADTLRAMPGDTLPGGQDIPVGPHRVVVSARGYRDLTETVTIAPG